MVEKIDDLNYEELIKEGKVLIDCYAVWCGPCKMISPIIDELAKEHEDIKFYKVDVDESNRITRDYQIMSIPTLLYFKDGVLENKIIGLRSKSEIEEILK